MSESDSLPTRGTIISDVMEEEKEWEKRTGEETAQIWSMHGGSKSRAGIKFRRNERSMDGGIPPETERRCA